MIRKRNNPKTRGPGIAAVGYLIVALSAGLIVAALKAGQLTGLPVWIYWVPMLLGILGVVAGFIVGASGILVTWASLGNHEVSLAWLTIRSAHLQWRISALLFKCSAACMF